LRDDTYTGRTGCTIVQKRWGTQSLIRRVLHVYAFFRPAQLHAASPLGGEVTNQLTKKKATQVNSHSMSKIFLIFTTHFQSSLDMSSRKTSFKQSMDSREILLKIWFV